MQNIRSTLIVVSAMACLAIMAVLTASFAIAFVGIVALVSLGRTVSTRLKPVPVKAGDGKRDVRVWHDGRGTIIDL